MFVPRKFQTTLIAKMMLLSGVMLMTASLPAFAGFEWRGPVSAPAKNAAPKDDMTGLEPITWDGADGAMPQQRVPNVEVTPIEFEPLPGASVSKTTTATKTFTEPGEILSGFGHDLPLIMALQQVAPAGYQFSFAPGVDAGQNVSWDGGRGWKTVLADMLASKGLSYDAEGKNLRIKRGVSSTHSESAEVLQPVQTLVVTPPPVPENRIQTPDAGKPGDVVTIRRQKSLMLRPAAPEAPQNIAVQPPASPMAAENLAPLPPTPLPAAEMLTAEERGPTVLTPPPTLPVPAPMPAPAEIREMPPIAQAEAPVPVAEKKEEKKNTSSWHATRGETLRQVLEAWTDQAGIDLYWSIDYDYKLGQDIDVKGSFETAVQNLLDRFEKAKPQPYGQLHQNSQGPKVLVVKVYE